MKWNKYNKNEGRKNGGGCVHDKKHGLLMLLCCLIPITILMILPFVNISNQMIRSILNVGVILLCPLMHIGMMLVMMKYQKKDAE